MRRSTFSRHSGRSSTRGFQPANRRAPITLALVVAGSLAFSACSSSGENQAENQAKEESTTATTQTTAQTTTAESSSSKKPHPTLGGETGSQAQGQASSNPSGSRNGGKNCGVNNDADAIYDNIHQVPGPNLDGTSWSYGGESNYDPCADLSYATLDQVPKGNAQFARQIMLFHKGEYIGVGTLSTQHHIGVINTTNDSITVRYKDYEALDAAGKGHVDSPNYTADVTYRWNGEKVVPEDPIPNMKYYHP